ncbi:hypothetical protein PFISCL1PPCAC_7382 [Pristionchus fissidentatus]|uniref:Uncharacterized protein n=1 Tax=Pristionchus fissidentatus TaxID=1538716 RepID=A0AAV5V8W9_9BILA|nr:hypothetical protein PFISCL1PPCAC_7382 [Pristionchus fissidentatus]
MTEPNWATTKTWRVAAATADYTDKFEIMDLVHGDEIPDWAWYLGYAAIALVVLVICGLGVYWAFFRGKKRQERAAAKPVSMADLEGRQPLNQ